MQHLSFSLSISFQIRCAVPILLLFAVVIFAACDVVRENDLAGYWEFYGHPVAPFQFLYFKGDSVYIEGGYGYRQRGTFQIKKNQLILKSSYNCVSSIPILKMDKDSLWLSDSSIMIRLPEVEINNFTTFPLPDLNILNDPPGERLYQSMHYYRNKNGKSTLRLGDKVTSFRDIPMYVTWLREDAQPDILIFLDKGISLPQLDTLYRHLAIYQINWNHVVLGLNGFHHYKIFSFHLPLWHEQVEEFKSTINFPLPPPTPNPYPLREVYLANNSQLVSIKSMADIERIYAMQSERNYLVSFSTQLSLIDFLNLTVELYQFAQERQIRFRTEFFYP